MISHGKKPFFFKSLYWAILILVMIISLDSSAQNPLNPDLPYLTASGKGRMIASKFTFSLAPGFSFVGWSPNLQNVAAIRLSENTLISERLNNPLAGNVFLRNWLNEPQNISRPAVAEVERIISANDTISMQYMGYGRGIPIQLGIHYTISERFRIGLGLSQEYLTMPGILRLKGNNTSELSLPYEEQSATFRKLFLFMGAKILDYQRYSLFADLQIGNGNYRRGFDSTVVADNTINLGLSWEYNFSIYSAAFVRAGVESRSYTIAPSAFALPIEVNNPVYGIQFGLRLRYPDLKSCPISSCNVRYVHHHSGVEFKGSSIFRKQNPRYGEGYGKKDVERR